MVRKNIQMVTGVYLSTSFKKNIFYINCFEGVNVTHNPIHSVKQSLLI